MAIGISCDLQGVREFQATMRIFDTEMQKQVHSKLVSWAISVKAEAMRRVPVRTGFLRSSIYSEVKDWVVNLGAEATYASFVELGTRYMQAQPYLYPAIQQCLPQLESLIAEAIKAAKMEVGER